MKEGNQIRIRMILKGRQVLHIDLAEAKLKKFLEMIEMPIKITNDLKKIGNNLVITIYKK